MQRYHLAAFVTCLTVFNACGSASLTPAQNTNGGSGGGGNQPSGEQPSPGGEPSPSNSAPEGPSSPEPSAPVGPTSPLAGDWVEHHLGLITPATSFIHVANDGAVTTTTGASDGTPGSTQMSYAFDPAGSTITRKIFGGETREQTVHIASDFVVSAARRTGKTNIYRQTTTTANNLGKQAFTLNYTVTTKDDQASITRAFACDSASCFETTPAQTSFKCAQVSDTDPDFGFTDNLGFAVYSCVTGTEDPVPALLSADALVFGKPDFALLRAKYRAAEEAPVNPVGRFHSIRGTSFAERRHQSALLIFGHQVRQNKVLFARGAKLNLGYDSELHEFARLEDEAGGAPPRVSTGVLANAYLDAMLFDEQASTDSTEVYRGFTMTVFTSVFRQEFTLTLTPNVEGLAFTFEQRSCSSGDCSGATPTIQTGTTAIEANPIPGLATITLPKGSSTVKIAYAQRRLVGMVQGGQSFVRISD